MATINLIVSDICKVFEESCVGSKVLDKEAFMALVGKVVEKHDPTLTAGAPGQYNILLPEAANKLVSAGVGKRTADPNDFILRSHRGRVELFLQRKFAAQAESVSVILYTREAYVSDPEVDSVKVPLEATHVLVAVLASAGPQSPRTPYRMLAGMAGANNEFAWMNSALAGMGIGAGYSRAKVNLPALKELESKVKGLVTAAQAVTDYDREWAVVAD